MARPRKGNLKPTTSVTITEDLFNEMKPIRPSHKTWAEFMYQVFVEWRELRTVSEGQAKVIEFSNKIKNELKQENEKLKQRIDILEANNKSLQEGIKV